ncbi:putative Mg(2+) transport ATPase [Chlamydia abortus]|jgi:putative Mg2+ transporter-C (MgtC) family protein|uniref:MgtC/SapB family protein n=1 Tax=Paenibacillus residui TaxID=629724 RepID=A0ABW3D5L8_9BACL|nr:MgtC/SapB family protein [Paenibacillus sp. 32O-W]SHE14424.1 putative Mg(2+) transport ATPase [Chlamydia abortus]
MSINPELWQISNFDLTIRIILALLLGGLIGLEREWNNHAAGFRTHILVCVGSASIMLLSIYGFSAFVYEANVRTDPARLAAQVISGIGFLGAGAILRTGPTVSGLTTAASIWVVAAIGLSVGAGFYYAAILVTGLVLISLFLLNKWEKHMMWHRRTQEITLRIVDRPGSLGNIATLLGNHSIQIKNIHMEHEQGLMFSEDENIIKIRLTLQLLSADKLVDALDELTRLETVLAVDSGHISGSGKSGKGRAAFQKGKGINKAG